jgi:hypothetical protein
VLLEASAVSRRPRTLGWVGVGLLALASVLLGGGSPARERPGALPLRLLGPVSSAAAGLQWVRVHASMRASRTDQALARSRLALELDPGATEGWLLLGGHLAFDRASAEREPSPERRLAWVRAGLALAARGERRARDPARLALWQGLVLGKLAQEDEPLPWPGGARGLWLEAARHFERAAALGAADGEALAASARGRAQEADAGEPGR